MKSKTAIAGSLYEVLSALLNDAGRFFPQLQPSFNLDKVRLRKIENQYGERLYVELLPALDSILLQALDTGKYMGHSAPLTGSWTTQIMVPRLFRGLYLLVFDSTGCLRTSPDTTAIFFLRQIFCLWKKLRIEPKKGATDETVSQYFRTDASLPSPDSSGWSSSSGPSVRDRALSLFQVFDLGHNWEHRLRETGGLDEQCIRRFVGSLEAVASIVFSTIGVPSHWSQLVPKNGRGVVSDLRKTDYKYSHNYWDDTLDASFPVSEFFRTSSTVLAAEITYNESSRTSRLAAVPKTYKGPRLIASEPCCFQWSQQALLHFTRERIEKSWLGSFVKLNDQTQNREYAREASLTGKLATLDLSEASDRVSLWLIERLIRNNPDYLWLLMTSRSRFTSATLFSGVADYELRKFATMGSAMTFPIETLVFLTFSIAACLSQAGRHVSIKNIKSLIGSVSIYGDDIVVPVEAADLLGQGLSLFWFKVNSQKSFWNGKFRESCGLDAYNGVDVTPVKCKSLPKSRNVEDAQSLLDASNNLFEKGCWLASDKIAMQVQKFSRERIPVRHVSSTAIGFSSYVGSSYRVKWDANLCRNLRRRLVIGYRQSIMSHDGSYAPVIQFATEKPGSEANWQSGVVARGKPFFGYSWE